MQASASPSRLVQESKTLSLLRPSRVRQSAAVVAAMCCMACAEGSWTPANLSPPPTGGVGDGNPTRVTQPLPPGATTWAEMTWWDPVTGRSRVITNPGLNGGTPTFSATVQAGTEGAIFIVPDKVNGKTVTDLHQHHMLAGQRGESSVGTLEVAAFDFAQDGELTMVGLSEWLGSRGYVNGNGIRVPDFLSLDGTSIYYGVDLNQWDALGIPLDESVLGQVHTFVNGVSDTLPGVLMSTSPMEVGPSGWMITNRDGFNGAARIDTWHEFDEVSVPEPASLLLGAAGWLLLARRKR